MTFFLNNTLNPGTALTVLGMALAIGGCQTLYKTPVPPPVPAAIVLESPPTDAPIGIAEGHDSPDITPAVKLSGPLYTWTQYGDAGNLSARAIFKNSTAPNCPKMTVDTSTSVTAIIMPMSLRSSTPPPNFDNIWVCQADIPKDATRALIGAAGLPLGSSDPQKIVVLGDTGCRVKGNDIQNCDGSLSTEKWNYAGIAAKAATENPDLILHVGDYHYREYIYGRNGKQTSCSAQLPCPPGFAPDTLGFSWDSWEADFFKPSGQLLTIAPLILTRGNHEDCSRAGTGWFYLLDPASTYQQCQTNTSPYFVEFDNFQVAVMDTSNSNRLRASQFAPEFTTIFQKAAASSKPTWISTHVPIMAATSYGVSNYHLIKASSQACYPDSAGQTKCGFPTEVAMNLAGHVHLFEKVSFKSNNPPQMVFGASGTELESRVPTASEVASQLQAQQPDLSGFLTSLTFDYGLFTSNGNDWSVDVKTIDGQPPLNFSILKDRVSGAPS